MDNKLIWLVINTESRFGPHVWSIILTLCQAALSLVNNDCYVIECWNIADEIEAQSDSDVVKQMSSENARDWTFHAFGGISIEQPQKYRLSNLYIEFAINDYLIAIN